MDIVPASETPAGRMAAGHFYTDVPNTAITVHLREGLAVRDRLTVFQSSRKCRLNKLFALLSISPIFVFAIYTMALLQIYEVYLKHI